MNCQELRMIVILLERDLKKLGSNLSRLNVPLVEDGLMLLVLISIQIYFIDSEDKMLISECHQVLNGTF